MSDPLTNFLSSLNSSSLGTVVQNVGVNALESFAAGQAATVLGNVINTAASAVTGKPAQPAVAAAAGTPRGTIKAGDYESLPPALKGLIKSEIDAGTVTLVSD